MAGADSQAAVCVPPTGHVDDDGRLQGEVTTMNFSI